MRFEETSRDGNGRAHDNIHGKQRRRQCDRKDKKKGRGGGYEALPNEGQEIWKGQSLVTSCKCQSYYQTIETYQRQPNCHDPATIAIKRDIDVTVIIRH